MNAFQKVIDREAKNMTSLGSLAINSAGRQTVLSYMTRGRGFRQMAAELATDDQGLTRGQKRRKARAEANARVTERRDVKYLHSAARRAAEAA